MRALPIFYILLAGCAGVAPAASDLAPPSPRLMAAPTPLSEVKAGDDNYNGNTQCSAAYVRETGRLRSLQRYVTTVLKKD